jgi:hypothetical protein
MARFVVVQAHGAPWDDSLGLRAQTLWDEHAAFMDALTEEGFVRLGGPLGDNRRALLVIEADSEDQIRERLAPDPWMVSGHLFTERIDAWEVLLDHGAPRPAG